MLPTDTQRETLLGRPYGLACARGDHDIVERVKGKAGSIRHAGSQTVMLCWCMPLPVVMIAVIAALRSVLILSSLMTPETDLVVCGDLHHFEDPSLPRMMN